MTGKPPVPSPSGKVAPHAIPTKGEKVTTWTPKYLAAIANAETGAELAEWDKLNDGGLNIVNERAPELYETIVGAFMKRKGDLAPKPAEPSPSPKDDRPAMAENPEACLKWIDARLAKITEAADLEPISLYNTEVEPMLKDAFPPDQQEAVALFRKHELRLGIE